jgi:site-specific recombinase XerD
VNPLKNQWGSVKPYTRHLGSCEHWNEKGYNACNCPKWLYERRKGRQSRRYSLNTPSWAEALEIAATTLKSFDPEIAEAREAKAEKKRNTKTILEAVNLWLERTKSQSGENSTYRNHRSTFGWIDQNGIIHGMLLGFAERWNAAHPEKAIITVDQMTPLVCQEWHDSDRFNKLAATTRKERWGTIRSFFDFLYQLGVIETNPVTAIKAGKSPNKFSNVPFSTEQYDEILSQTDWYVDDHIRNGEREVWCRRMHTLVELLRHTGMDLIDAVLFRPESIRYESIDGKMIPVLRYSRTKTGIEAVVVLSGAKAQMFHSIPMAPRSVPEMPFHYKNNQLRSDVCIWSRRIDKLFELSGINLVQLIGKDGRAALDENGNPVMKAPTAKMFRHTFAVALLTQGVPETNVAKALGHTSTKMLHDHYGPWCKTRDEQHLRELLRNSAARPPQESSRRQRVITHVREAQAAAAQRNAKNVVTVKAAR